MLKKKVNKAKSKSRKTVKTAPPKRGASAKQTSVNVSNLSNVSGELNIAGGNVTVTKTTTGISAAEVNRLFDQLHAAIESRAATSPADKKDLKAEVQEVQAAVTEAAKKNETVDESSISRHFRNIARMAPDILEVVVATLKNPLGGLGVAVEKIAAKAKEETQK